MCEMLERQKKKVSRERVPKIVTLCEECDLKSSFVNFFEEEQRFVKKMS